MSSTWIDAKTQKVHWLGTHQQKSTFILHREVFLQDFQFDDMKARYCANSTLCKTVLLRLSAEKSQQKAKTIRF